ncbi:MAG: type VI secretion system contractile sheath large subunit, partial [Pseudomonadota bacterium]
MSSRRIQSSPLAVEDNTAVSLEQLYGRPAYVIKTDQFITENSDAQALAYWLREFTHTQGIHTKEDLIYAIQGDICKLDHLINDQLNAIIQHRKFKTLEASWRGLDYLAKQVLGTKNIKIKVLDVAWHEVVRDMERALEFDQSQLFQKIYNEEYGSPGGEPYGVLIGDYEINHRPTAEHPHDDLSALAGIAQVAAASFAPFI